MLLTLMLYVKINVVLMLLNTIINVVSIFVNKFTLSIITLNNVIYLSFIVFFII